MKIALITLTILVLFIFGMMDGIRDTLMFHYKDSRFAKRKRQKFYDPSISWMNKYKNGAWVEGEKFFLSTTLLAWATDFFHLTKTIGASLIQILIVILLVAYIGLQWWWVFVLFVGAKLVQGLGFYLTYKWWK